MKSARNVRSKVRSALESQSEEGVWLDDDEISAELFVKHFNAMTTYLEGVRGSRRP